MKKIFTYLFIVCAICAFMMTGCDLSACDLSQRPDYIESTYGTLTVEDLSLLEGQTAKINYTFTKEGINEAIEWTFEGNNISIVDGVVTAIVPETVTEVTAKTEHLEAKFTVTVGTDYGTLFLSNMEVSFGQESPIIPVFSREDREEAVEYTFEGNNISIEKGLVKGLVPGTTTTVNAKTAHHEASFEVKVNYLEGVLTNPDGNESKIALPTPEGVDKYVVFATVDVETYRNGFTRLSSFAFNASDNSWYNIEMNDQGEIILYARFNGIEKYHIRLFNKADVMIDGKIHYEVAIYRDGQSTAFFVNGKAVCAFSESEMKGYATLGNLEVTAAADRDEYKINLLQIYYSTDASVIAEYEQKANVISYGDGVLASADGNESKVSYGNVHSLFKNFVYTSTVSVNAYVNDWTRTSAFAFNGTDNSWYNIETDASGNFTLYARFNGVEKYWIHLFNKNDAGIIVDGKITYTVAILKQGQATYFFVNDTLACSFSEVEMNGYPRLETLEATALANRVPGAYDISVLNATVSGESTETYANYAAKTQLTFGDGVLANADGNESKVSYGSVALTYDKFVYTSTVSVNAYVNDWTRTSAFAFNGTDNSWYNVETDASGNFTLYARFNGVEKYWIHLFNKNDAGIIVDGKITYTVALLKDGQSTYFFVNDKLVCSFGGAEMNGYPRLETLEATALANRVPGAYDISLLNATVSNGNSETYANYMAKTQLTFADGVLANADGHESKIGYGNIYPLHGSFIYTSKITVNSNIEKWTRPSAFAFNGTDNSWYNIETDASGNFTLYARFNGVEKYGIHLFHKDDAGIIVDGKITYTVAILKQGQATYFFVNDTLACSFSEAEMNGYARLETLEVSACSNRDPAAYDISVSDAQISGASSALYAEYLAKIA